VSDNMHITNSGTFAIIYITLASGLWN